MKPISRIVLAILLVTLFGCWDNNPVTVINGNTVSISERSFSETVRLKGENFITDSLKFPIRIAVSAKHNRLFVTDTKTDYLVNVFDLKNKNYTNGLAHNGEGPSELIQAQEIQVIDHLGVVSVHGMMQRRLQLYQMENVLNDQNPVPFEVIDLKDRHTSQPRYLGSGRVLDINHTMDGNLISRLNQLNKEGSVISSHGEYPVIEKEQGEPIYKSEVFTSFLSSNESLSTFVLSYAFTDRIEIYDENFNLKKQITGPDNFPPMLQAQKISAGATSVTPVKGARKGYLHAAVGEDEFFLLFDGRFTSQRGYHLNEIFSFDLEGNPLKRYKLDTPIFGFDVDWENGAIYGITHESSVKGEEVAIVKFNLPK